MNTTATPFFFRAADRMRIEGCLNALTQDGMNLAVCCEQEALLDHYLDILLTRLGAQAPWLQQEVYFPTNTESLLARFNDILARQSVQDAVKSSKDERDARLWIVHDAQSLPEPELQLLARLIQNFPGANIRALLVMAGPSERHPQLSAFGRKILKWDIELPAPDQAQLALDAAGSDSERALIERLLRKMGRRSGPQDLPTDLLTELSAPPSVAAAPPPSPPGPKPGAWRLPRWASALAALPKRPGLSPLGRPRPTRPFPARSLGWPGPLQRLQQHGKLVLIGVGLLLGSALLMLWLQPQAFGIAPRASSKIGPAAVAATPPAAVPEAPSSASLPAAGPAQRPQPPSPKESGR